MNRVTTDDLSGPVPQALIRYAGWCKVRDMFNLKPLNLSKYLARYYIAKKDGAAREATRQELKKALRGFFSRWIANIKSAMEDQPRCHDYSDYVVFHDYFIGGPLLDDTHSIARSIKDKAAYHGISEEALLEYIEATLQGVIEHTVDTVIYLWSPASGDSPEVKVDQSLVVPHGFDKEALLHHFREEYGFDPAKFSRSIRAVAKTTAVGQDELFGYMKSVLPGLLAEAWVTTAKAHG